MRADMICANKKAKIKWHKIHGVLVLRQNPMRQLPPSMPVIPVEVYMKTGMEILYPNFFNARNFFISVLQLV